MKRVISLVLGILMGMIGIFVSVGRTPPGDKTISDMKVKVVMPMLSMEFEAELADSLMKYLEKYGFEEVDCVSYELDTMKAIEILENCIAEEVDMICMYPVNDSTAVIQHEAMDQGIGMITVGMDNKSYDYLVLMDSGKTGRIIAEMSYSWIVRNLPRGSQIATIGTNINSDMTALTNSMNERLKELVGEEYEIVEMAILDGTGQDALPYVESLLERYPKLKVVAAYNDSYAISAAEVFHIMGKEDDNIGVFGCGATSRVLDQISEGKFVRGTVSPGDGARKWADAAYVWANKELREEKVRYTFNIPVTIDNVHSYREKDEG